jgi:uncharacterized membrane protein YeaQ/YmgE (transglycosylase-associated protein family)
MQGFILSMISFFIGSFLLLRLLSPWAKTYWRKDLIIALLQAVVFAIILVTLSQNNNNNNNFSTIISALAKNTTELNNEVGIIQSGTASNSNQNLIMERINIKR